MSQQNQNQPPLTLYQKLRLIIGEYLALTSPFKHTPTLTEMKNFKAGVASMTYPINSISPSIILCDGPQGLRIGSRFFKTETTAFPSMMCLGATFNIEMAELQGRAIGSECAERQIGVLLGPAINLHRHPLAGRTYETFSEDPRISGELGGAYIRGIQQNGIAACVKHFVANNQEIEREEVDVIATERTLRELYIEGFRIAFESEPMTLMTSYNRVNGEYAGENENFRRLIRDEMHYDGLIMTDWYACKDSVKMILGGNNRIEPGKSDNFNRLMDEIKKGNTELMKLIDDSVERNIKLTNSIRFNKQDVNCKLAAREVATEGCVLLKNTENCLPIQKGMKVCLAGVASYQAFTKGIGSGQTNSTKNISIYEGLRKNGIEIDTRIETIYRMDLVKQNKRPKQHHAVVFEVYQDYDEMRLPKEHIIKSSQEADIAIYTIGRVIGEFYDRKESSYHLQQNELKTIKSLSKHFHAQNKKLVVVLNIGGPIEMESWKNYVDGIVVCWINGEECGNAVGDILTGIQTPSGRLPTTFPLNLQQRCLQSYPGNDPIKPTKVVYDENIYVGYRYYTTFNKEVSYPFGFGLSYTQFEWSEFELNVNYEEQFIECKVKVKNIGECQGKDVVQIYLQRNDKKLEYPIVELKGFAKTKLLSSGEEDILVIKRSFRDLSSFDEELKSWIMEDGIYTIHFNRDCLTSVERKEFTINELLITQQSDVYCPPHEEIQLLSKRDTENNETNASEGK